MNPTMKLFQIGLRQIGKDGLLLILLPTPILVGLVFRFGIPYANTLLEDGFSFSLLPWYGLADGMLVCLTPMFVAMVSAFLMLDERDEGLSAFYQITPTGGVSYLLARIGIPMIWAFASTVIVAGLLHISGLSVAVLLAASFLSALSGIAMAMMVVSIAGNRVEGLAWSKLMAVTILGLILLWFIPGPYSYMLAFLPSFWIGKVIVGGASAYTVVPGLCSCALWIAVFCKRFLSKVL
jgi:fluoroquinolone transport system permease protein